jgi:hypothetical protein
VILLRSLLMLPLLLLLLSLFLLLLLPLPQPLLTLLVPPVLQLPRLQCHCDCHSTSRRLFV